MRVLGIDPGYSRFGWALIEKEEHLKLIDFDCLNLNKNIEVAIKLLKISEFLEELINKHHPNLIVTEKVFFSKNVKTAIQVAQVEGIVLLEAAKSNISLLRISPNEVKKYLTGWGFSRKEGIKKVLSLIFGQELKSNKVDDAYDALALAVVGESLIRLENLEVK